MQNKTDKMENRGTSSDTAMELPGEMSERARYFTEKFDALMEKYKFETDQNAISLRKKVVAWLNSSGDLVVPRFVDAVGKTVDALFDNASLQTEVKRLISTVATLENENGALNRRVVELEERLLSLELEREERDLNITTSDLSRMYAKYVIVPLLPTFLSTPASNDYWGRFCEKYREQEADVDDGNLTAVDFENWLKPLTSQLTVNLKLLMDIIKRSNSDSHSDICSAKKQKDFIASLPSSLLSAEKGEHHRLMVDIVTALKNPKIKFTRMC